MASSSSTFPFPTSTPSCNSMAATDASLDLLVQFAQECQSLGRSVSSDGEQSLINGIDTDISVLPFDAAFSNGPDASTESPSNSEAIISRDISQEPSAEPTIELLLSEASPRPEVLISSRRRASQRIQSRTSQQQAPLTTAKSPSSSGRGASGSKSHRTEQSNIARHAASTTQQRLAVPVSELKSSEHPTEQEGIANILFAYALRSPLCPPDDKHIASNPFSLFGVGETGGKRLGVWKKTPDLFNLLSVEYCEPTRRCHYVGLRNLGATCYMNSYLQTLFMNLDFRSKLFATRKNLNPEQAETDANVGSVNVNTRFPSLSSCLASDSVCSTFNNPCKLLPELQILFTALQSGMSQAADPTGVAKALKISPEHQEDATEFATLLLMALEKELGGYQSAENFIPELFRGRQSQSMICESCGVRSERTDDFYELRVRVHHQSSSTRSTNGSRPSRALKRNDAVVTRGNSQTGETDGGTSSPEIGASQVQTTTDGDQQEIEETKEDKESSGSESDPTRSMSQATQQVSDSLSGSTTQPSITSPVFYLESGLQQVFQTEFFSGDNRYMCSRCNKKVDAIRQVSLQSLPPYLHICFERYAYGESGRRKLTTPVNYPLTLSLKDYRTKTISSLLEEKEDKQTMIDDDTYELIGVLEHQGHSAQSGHYIAYLKDLTTDQMQQLQIEEQSGYIGDMQPQLGTRKVRKGKGKVTDLSADGVTEIKKIRKKRVKKSDMEVGDTTMKEMMIDSKIDGTLERRKRKAQKLKGEGSETLGCKTELEANKLVNDSQQSGDQLKLNEQQNRPQLSSEESRAERMEQILLENKLASRKKPRYNSNHQTDDSTGHRTKSRMSSYTTSGNYYGFYPSGPPPGIFRLPVETGGDYRIPDMMPMNDYAYSMYSQYQRSYYPNTLRPPFHQPSEMSATISGVPISMLPHPMFNAPTYSSIAPSTMVSQTMPVAYLPFPIISPQVPVMSSVTTSDGHQQQKHSFLVNSHHHSENSHTEIIHSSSSSSSSSSSVDVSSSGVGPSTAVGEGGLVIKSVGQIIASNNETGSTDERWTGNADAGLKGGLMNSVEEEGNNDEKMSESQVKEEVKDTEDRFITCVTVEMEESKQRTETRSDDQQTASIGRRIGEHKRHARVQVTDDEEKQKQPRKRIVKATQSISELVPTSELTDNQLGDTTDINRRWQWISFDDASVSEWRIENQFSKSDDKSQTSRLTSRSAYLLIYKRKAWIPAKEPPPPKLLDAGIQSKMDIEYQSLMAEQIAKFAKQRRDEVSNVIKRSVKSIQSQLNQMKEKYYSPTTESPFLDLLLTRMVCVPMSWWSAFICGYDFPSLVASLPPELRPTKNPVNPNTAGPPALSSQCGSIPTTEEIYYSDVLCFHSSNISLPRSDEGKEERSEGELENGTMRSGSYYIDPLAVWDGKVKVVPKEVVYGIFKTYNIKPSIPDILLSHVICRQCSNSFSQLLEYQYDQWNTITDMIRFVRDHETLTINECNNSEGTTSEYGTLTWISKRALMDAEGRYSVREKSKKCPDGKYDVYGAAEDTRKEISKLRLQLRNKKIPLSDCDRNDSQFFQSTESVDESVNIDKLPTLRSIDFSAGVVCIHNSLVPGKKPASRVLVPKDRLLRFLEVEQLRVALLISEFGLPQSVVTLTECKLSGSVDVDDWYLDGDRIVLIKPIDNRKCLTCEAESNKEKQEAHEWRRKMEDEKQKVGEFIYKRSCKLSKMHDVKRFAPWSLAQGRHYLVPNDWIDCYINNYIGSSDRASSEHPGIIDGSTLLMDKCPHHNEIRLKVNPISYLSGQLMTHLHPKDNNQHPESNVYQLVHESEFGTLNQIYGSTNVPYFNVKFVPDHSPDYNYDGSFIPCSDCVRSFRFVPGGVGDFHGVPLKLKVDLKSQQKLLRRPQLLVNGNTVIRTLIERVMAILQLPTELALSQLQFSLEGMTRISTRPEYLVSESVPGASPMYCQVPLPPSTFGSQLRNLEVQLEEGWTVLVTENTKPPSE